MERVDPSFNYTISVCHDKTLEGDEGVFIELRNASVDPPDKDEVISLPVDVLTDEERTALQFLHDQTDFPLGRVVRLLCWKHFVGGRKFQEGNGGDTTNLE